MIKDPLTSGMEQQIDLAHLESENNCFVCQEGGYVKICSGCPRVFHHHCLKDPSYQALISEEKSENCHEWLCPCCILTNICPVCNKSVQYKQQDASMKLFKCTICLRFVHKKCYSYSAQAVKMTSQNKESLMICIPCLTMNGIYYLKQKRIAYGKSYYLVKPFNSSHIHSGWVTFDQFNTIYQQMRKRILFKEQIVYTNQIKTHCQIQKILMIRPNFQTFSQTEQFISLQKNEIKGKKVKFLIKWKGLEVDEATWEDSKIIRTLQVFNILQFLKFNYRKWRVQGILDIRSLTKLLSEFQNHKIVESASIEWLQSLVYNQYAFHVLKQNLNETQIEILASLIRQIYYKVIYCENRIDSLVDTQPIIFVTDSPQHWRDVLAPYLQQFNLACCSRQQNFKDQIQIELFYHSKPIFDILFLKQESLLEIKQFKNVKFGLIIFQNRKLDQQKDTLWEQYQNCPLLVIYRPDELLIKHSIFIHRQQKIQSQFLKIKQAQSERNQLETDLNFLKKSSSAEKEQISSNEEKQGQVRQSFQIELRNLQEDIQNLGIDSNLKSDKITPSQKVIQVSDDQQRQAPNKQNQIIMISSSNSETGSKHIQDQDKLSQIYRLYFLIFVLQFGLNLQKNQLYKKFLESLPQKKKFEEQFKKESIFYQHLNGFLQNLFFGNQSAYYFSTWSCDKVIKRISCLAIIFKVYQKCVSKPQLFPIPSQFSFVIGKDEIKSSQWTTEDDIALIKMIMIYGYNNWAKICQNFQPLDVDSDIKGYSYLKEMIWPSLRRRRLCKDKIEACIKIRAQMILTSKQMAKFVKLKVGLNQKY